MKRFEVKEYPVDKPTSETKVEILASNLLWEEALLISDKCPENKIRFISTV